MDPLLAEMARVLKAGRSTAPLVTSEQARAQAQRSLMGITVEPPNGGCLGPCTAS